MDRQQVLEQEVEFLRKLVTSQNEMIGKLLAERAAVPVAPSPPQIVPVPYPVPAPAPCPPFPSIPTPWDPFTPITPWWGIPGTAPYPDIICRTTNEGEGCSMIPPSDLDITVRSAVQVEFSPPREAPALDANTLFAIRDSAAAWAMQHGAPYSTMQ
jgi:hypothetical protein